MEAPGTDHLDHDDPHNSTLHKDKVKFVHRTEPDLTPVVAGPVGESLTKEKDDNILSSTNLQDAHEHDIPAAEAKKSKHDNVVPTAAEAKSKHDVDAPPADELGLKDAGDTYDPDLLHELVLYDKLGNPYVDIFKLMFNHQKIRKQKKPEELTFRNYSPDFVFLLGKIVTLILSTITLLAGYSIITFISSLESTFSNSISDMYDAVEVPKASILKFTYVPKLMKAFPEAGLDKLTTGYLLIISSCTSITNSLIGMYASVQLYPKLIILHTVVNAFVLLLNIFVAFSYPECDGKDSVLFGSRMIHYIHSYTAVYEDEIEKERAQYGSIQLDDIQISLDCCGAFSWLDYLDMGVTDHEELASIKWEGEFIREKQKRRELSQIELVLPPSCCKPWWIKNIHCAVGMHKYAHPTATPEQLELFQKRISDKGCVQAVMEVCNRTTQLITVFLPIICGIHFIFLVLECIAVHVLSLRVAKIVRQKLLAAKREAAELTGEGYSDTSLNLEEPGKASDVEITANKNVPLPTEDQIQLIKLRSDFNKFEATMAYTHVGEWISAARRAVFKGNRRHPHGHENVHFDLQHVTTGKNQSRISLSKAPNRS